MNPAIRRFCDLKIARPLAAHRESSDPIAESPNHRIAR
jgi:hypothetical protein